MNFLLLVGWALLCLAVLWIAQTVALVIVGHRPIFKLPLRHGSDSTFVRWWMKFALQLVMLMILCFPVAIGENPIEYHLKLVQPAQWTLLVRTMAMTLSLFGVLLIITLLFDWVKVEPQHKWSTSFQKALKGSLTPLPLAFMEEAVFRGVALEQMWRSFSGTQAGQLLAILLSAALFCSVHFLRAQKRIFLPALGLFVLGVALGLAYIAGGHTIWLPVAMHAAGVWYIQVMRPFTTYKGPAWLIGYRSYPICGVLGLVLMALLTTWVIALA